MWKTAIYAFLVITTQLSSAFAETVQEAQDQASLEKAHAEAAASRLAARKSELDLQQAEELSTLSLQTVKDKVEEAQRKALTESIGLVNNLKTDSKDVSVIGNAIETKALANRAVSKAMEQVITTIHADVCNKKSTVILADDLAIGALPGYETGMLTLNTLASSYKALVKNAQQSFLDLKDMHDHKEKVAVAVLPALLQGVAAVGSIAQTFKTQLNITGADINIDQLAVFGALAGVWKKKCASSTLTAYPNLGVDFAQSKASKKLNEITDLLATGQDLESEITLWLIPNKVASEKELAEIQAATTSKTPKQKAITTAKKAAAEARKSAIAQIEAVLVKLKSDNLRVDQAIQQLFTTSEKQPVSPIVQLAKVERFATAVKSENAYVLTIKTVAGGGNTVTANNFWRGPKVLHSGGAVLAYTLLKGTDGAYVGGGLLDSHQGYVRLEITDQNSLGNSW